MSESPGSGGGAAGERRYHALRELTLWRVREFLREPEAVFWVFVFPVLLAFALGIAFQNRGPQQVRVGVVNDAPDAYAFQAMLESDSSVIAEVLDSAEAQNRLRTGRVAAVVVPADPVVLRYDSAREESHLARVLVTDALNRVSGRSDVAEIREQPITEPGSRYIDFLIPGLLGMNIMGTGMWGVGFAVVKARSQKLLKRLLASPMRKSQYLLSHMLSRLVFLALEVGAVLLFALLVFRVPVRGSLFGLALIVLLGALTFSGLGLLVASRSRTIEGVSGLMNLVMVPMWICSGVFFSSANFPDVVQPVIRALPLTALNDALRAVMIDGEPLASAGGMLAIVAAWGLVSFAIALRIFRWR
jgi:ABC-type multidrug transport system permease subunit